MSCGVWSRLVDFLASYDFFLRTNSNQKLKQYIQGRASDGLIDSLANMVGKKVYLYSGQNDTILTHKI